MNKGSKQVIGFLFDVARSLGIALGVIIGTFFLIRVIPGDVVDILGIQGDLTYEQQSHLREEKGLTKPWTEQFGIWVSMIAKGDFGVSARFNVPVINLIMSSLPTTIQLALLGLSIGLTLGIGLCVLALLYPNSIFKHLVNFITIWSITVPTFSIGLAAVVVLAVWLRIIPAVGNLLIPAIILGLDNAGTIAKMLYEDLKEIEHSDFVRTARSKGLGRSRIVLAHILPNSMASALSLIGIVFAGALSGTITLEVVFGLPGLGTLTLGAMHGRDYPLVQAVVIWLGLSVILANLITDAFQRILDPRIK